MQLSATELADRIGLSKGRISQLVSEGKLAGCYVGDGRQRRFDLDKAVQALKGNLDPAQMLGNGAETKRKLAELARTGGEEVERPRSASNRPDGPLSAWDNDRYELARIAKAEEDARAARLRNGREEGLYVYAPEVERAIAQVLAQEIAEFENVLRDGARAIADQHGVDFKATRKILIDIWRSHRATRADRLQQSSTSASPTQAEVQNNF